MQRCNHVGTAQSGPDREDATRRVWQPNTDAPIWSFWADHDHRKEYQEVPLMQGNGMCFSFKYRLQQSFVAVSDMTTTVLALFVTNTAVMKWCDDSCRRLPP